MPFLWAARNPFSAPTVTPLFPEITITALPAARMPSLMPPEKSNRPGVSSRFILVSFHSTGSRARDTEALRRISSGSKSHTVLPSEIFPSRSDLPDRKKAASASEVFPVPAWPTRATLRMFLALYCFMCDSPFVYPAEGHSTDCEQLCTKYVQTNCLALIIISYPVPLFN